MQVANRRYGESILPNMLPRIGQYAFDKSKICFVKSPTKIQRIDY